MLQPDDIRRTRKAQGLSLRELGKKTGIAHSTISRIENGKVSPTWDTLSKLSCALSFPRSLEYFDYTSGTRKEICLIEKKDSLRGDGLVLELFATSEGEEVIIIRREQ